MVVHKRKKFQKYRGSKTHGGGSMKKRRGSGNRGGFGNAGTGKRADQKKISILKEYGLAYFGKHGFKRHVRLPSENTINIAQLPDTPELNLKNLGYTKLLGKGVPKQKYKITVDACSAKAKEKIEKNGGEVIVLAAAENTE